MPETKELFDILQAHLPWHRARLMFAATFALALIKVRTVTFGQLALVLNPNATPNANYRRIQRFFANFSLDAERFGRLMLALLPQKEKLVVSIDRSNWQLGNFHINILMLSVAYRGIAFPIVWTLLGKAGNSKRTERTTLLERFLKLVEPQKIAAVVADREFIGESWFKDLKAAGLPFYIRIKHNTLVSSKGRTRHARILFESLRVGEVKLLPKRYWVYGHRLSLVGVKLDGEYLIVATNAKVDHALALYSQRWQVETLFAALKSRGFNLDASHLQHDERIAKLLALLALAFAWAHLVGEWLHDRKPIPIKKHGRLAKSFFRHGLDHLQFVLLNIQHQQAEFCRCLRLLQPLRVLSCT
jgi:hypothetical protein